ncbi:MAG: hypothetical protein SGARI_000372 [Bacillariaceae sp.]
MNNTRQEIREQLGAFLQAYATDEQKGRCIAYMLLDMRAIVGREPESASEASFRLKSAVRCFASGDLTMLELRYSSLIDNVAYHRHETLLALMDLQANYPETPPLPRPPRSIETGSAASRASSLSIPEGIPEGRDDDEQGTMARIDRNFGVLDLHALGGDASSAGSFPSKASTVGLDVDAASVTGSTGPSTNE